MQRVKPRATGYTAATDGICLSVEEYASYLYPVETWVVTIPNLNTVLMNGFSTSFSTMATK